METLPKRKTWTAVEYHHMVDLGIISPDEKVELIDGEIITMAAKKPPHVIVTELIAEYFRELFKGVAHIRVQDPVVLSDHSEPEPDIAVVMPPLRRYLDHHPRPEEIFLIIEVADRTLRFDAKNKAKMYAESGIADYWIVDVRLEQVCTFQKPVDGEYTNKSVLSSNNTITLPAFLGIEVAFQEFFP